MIFPLPFAALALYLPESPTFLMENVGEPEALRSLEWYRGDISKHLVLEEYLDKKVSL